MAAALHVAMGWPTDWSAVFALASLSAAILGSRNIHGPTRANDSLRARHCLSSMELTVAGPLPPLGDGCIGPPADSGVRAPASRRRVSSRSATCWSVMAPETLSPCNRRRPYGTLLLGKVPRYTGTTRCLVESMRAISI